MWRLVLSGAMLANNPLSKIQHSRPQRPTTNPPATDNVSDVLVIGAGFGGIAAALRMRARGFSVTLVERLPEIGGRAQVFNKGGFKHDAGPTVITAPFSLMNYSSFLAKSAPTF